MFSVALATYCGLIGVLQLPPNIRRQFMCLAFIIRQASSMLVACLNVSCGSAFYDFRAFFSISSQHSSVGVFRVGLRLQYTFDTHFTHASSVQCSVCTVCMHVHIHCVCRFGLTSVPTFGSSPPACFIIIWRFSIPCVWRSSIWVILRALYATCCPYRRVRPQHMSAVPPSPLLSELVLPLNGGFRRPLGLQRIPSVHLALVLLHPRAAAGVILLLHLQL